MNTRSLVLSLLVLFSAVSARSQVSSLSFNDVDIAGIKLGMSIADVRALHPQIQVLTKKIEFRGVPVEYLEGEIRELSGGSGEYVDILFDRESKVLRIYYIVNFDGEGKSIMETATEINAAKDRVLRKFGPPDVEETKHIDTEMAYALSRQGGLSDEGELQVRISRTPIYSEKRMSGSLWMRLTDRMGLIKMKTSWIQEDAARTPKEKAQKLHF